MKKFSIVFNILIFFAVIFLLYRSFAKEKQVYINVPKLVAQYQGMKDVQKLLEERSKVWKANVDTLGKELENEIKKYEKDRSKNSEKENKLYEERLRNKQQQFMQYREAMQQKSADEDKKMKEKLLADINGYVKEYGDEHHYNYIIGASNNGNLAYANPAFDITDQVLEGLNKRYKRK